MPGQQMFDQRGDAVVLLSVELGILKKRKIARPANSFYILENAKGILAKFL